MNDILNNKYVVVKNENINDVINILENFGYFHRRAISYIDEDDQYAIESESEDLFVFSYDFYVKICQDKKETDLKVLLREQKLKRILKTKSLLK